MAEKKAPAAKQQAEAEVAPSAVEPEPVDEPKIETVPVKEARGLGERSDGFADNEYRLEQLRQHAYEMFEQPPFVVEVAVMNFGGGRDGKDTWTVAEAKAAIKKFNSNQEA